MQSPNLPASHPNRRIWSPGHLLSGRVTQKGGGRLGPGLLHRFVLPLHLGTEQPWGLPPHGSLCQERVQKRQLWGFTGADAKVATAAREAQGARSLELVPEVSEQDWSWRRGILAIWPCRSFPTCSSCCSSRAPRSPRVATSPWDEVDARESQGQGKREVPVAQEGRARLLPWDGPRVVGVNPGRDQGSSRPSPLPAGPGSISRSGELERTREED